MMSGVVCLMCVYYCVLEHVSLGVMRVKSDTTLFGLHIDQNDPDQDRLIKARP